MAATFTCPNPACSQVFSLQDIKGAGSLTCPKCGTIFHFRTSPGGSPRGDLPTLSPELPTAVPLAQPITPSSSPTPGEEDAEASVGDEDLPEGFALPEASILRQSRKARLSRRSGRWLTLAAVLGALALLGGLVVFWCWDWIVEASQEWGRSPEAISTLPFRAANFSFRFPRSLWEKDQEAEQAFGANLLLRHKDSQLWLALVYVDYKDRMPREDDMLKSAAARLRGYFQKLEWQQQEGGTLSGRPAQRLTFQGECHDEAMTGECLLLAHQGLAYWVFTWAPASSDQAALPDQWTEIRQGFTLLREREGWRGKVPRTAAIQGKKASYQLRYAEDIWSPLGTTGSADLVLLGRDPEDRKNALKTATITVYVRPVQPDLEAALKEARGLTEAKEKEVLPDTIMEPVPAGDKSGFPEGVVKLGQAKARVARLRIKSGEERGRFLALAVIPWTGCTLVIQCECAWTHLPSWEERFGPVLQSLSFSQSETSKDH